MREQFDHGNAESFSAERSMSSVEGVGKVTILELLAEGTNMISLDSSHRSTQTGTGVDFEDD